MRFNAVRCDQCMKDITLEEKYQVVNSARPQNILKEVCNVCASKFFELKEASK